MAWLARTRVAALVAAFSLTLVGSGTASAAPDEIGLRFAFANLYVGGRAVGLTDIVVRRSGEAEITYNIDGLVHGRAYNVALYAGTCGALGKRLYLHHDPPTDATFWDHRLWLTKSEAATTIAALRTGKVSLIYGSMSRCGTFGKARTCRPAVSAPQTWRAVAFVYRDARFSYRDAAGTLREFSSHFTDEEIAQIRTAAAGVPTDVAELSAGAVSMTVEVRVLDQPLTVVTPWPGPRDLVATPIDTWRDVRTASADGGRWDAYYVIWKPWNDTTQLDLSYWGMAKLADYTGAPFGSLLYLPGVGVAPDLFVHEWLHDVVAYFYGWGYEQLTGPDQASDYGYSDAHAFMRDLMSGKLHDASGTMTGIPLSAWSLGRPSTLPFVCSV